jgi:hypothetical protein
MTFKRGDRVRNENGEAGEILYVDRDGLEAQVAFQRVTLKMRSDSLDKMSPDEPLNLAAPPAKVRSVPTKLTSVRRSQKR